MRRLPVAIAVGAICIAASSLAVIGQHRGQQRRTQQTRQPEPFFHTDVPDHPFDIVLGRPTDTSITVSIVAYPDCSGYITYGVAPGAHTERTRELRLPAREPVEMVLEPLPGDSKVYYRLRYRPNGAAAFSESDEHYFHTQRPPGSAFTFTVTADSHLDENAQPAIYARALRNALADRPDFHIDLGDTSMVGKIRGLGIEPVLPYLAQRYYFGLLCHSTPLFLVLGNHDGESPAEGPTALALRTKHLPDPQPDGFYAGNDGVYEGVGPMQNYYAWEWGDSLFIVLDPYWYTPGRVRTQEDNWLRTLGRTQYDWLKGTLENSGAQHRFVFIHHLVGGLDKQGRGGAEGATLYEWSGHSQDGTLRFAEMRSGWAEPIHDLLVRTGVSIVFRGHDHFFARQDLDGIVYQLVPQPGHLPQRSVRVAQEYGYTQGDLLGSPGHLRVSVSAGEATVDYVRAHLPEHELNNRRNGDVDYSYTVRAPHLGGRR